MVVADQWKAHAKECDLTLSAWIRMKCSEVSASDLEMTTPKRIMEATAVNPSNAKYYHTASSNRLTCMCETCYSYREKHDIPLGGFKK